MKINVMTTVCSYSHGVHKIIFTANDYNHLLHNYANAIMILTKFKASMIVRLKRYMIKSQ